MKLSSYLLIFVAVLCILLTNIIDHCNGQSTSSDNTNSGGADEESSEAKESREMEAFMKLIMKSSQKHLKRMLETVDIGLITGTKCNSSWHQFMTDNQLSPERFSAIMDEYKSGNHEKIIKLVRPEQCLTSENGKFCQIDHLTNITSRSKARVFDVTYALCYPRGCSTDELNKIMSTLTESYKGMATIQMKLNIVKCTTSMGEVTQMEIDTAQKLFQKMTNSGSINQTLEMSKFKFPGSKGAPVGLGPSFPTQPFPTLADLPNFQLNVPEDVPMFSFDTINFSKQFSTSAPPLTTSTSSYPSLSISLNPSTTSTSSSTTSFSSSPISTNSFATVTKSPSIPTSTSTESSIEKPSPHITPSHHPVFKWPETTSSSDEISDGTNPLLYPDILYSNPDMITESPSESSSSSFSLSSPTSNPLDISQFDEKLLRKMIPGLLVQGD